MQDATETLLLRRAHVRGKHVGYIIKKKAIGNVGMTTVFFKENAYLVND